MHVLGISAFYHDSAACLLRDGKLLCAVEEEKLSRAKHDKGLPWLAIDFCLQTGGIGIQDIDVVAFYEKPQKRLSRQIWMGIHPSASPNLKRQVLRRLDPGFVSRQIREAIGFLGPIDFVEHHEAHAASSYFFSGFEDAAIMTFDGVGEWATSAYGSATGHNLELFEEVHFPHSLGLLYSAITAYLGFEVNDGEHKVMGLAPYGLPKYVDKLHRLIEMGENGQYRLNLEFFALFETDKIYSQRMVDLFGYPPRHPESDLLPFHKDIAKSLQAVLEEVLLLKARYLHQRIPSRNLCLAGGVALNCVANGRILRDGPFQDLFVQPAAGDSGGAVGAAALAYARRTNSWPIRKRLKEAYLGPSYSSDDIASVIEASGITALDFRGRSEVLVEEVVDRLVTGNVVGWFFGAMEFGPRALGARSILGDPRDPGIRDRINAIVKMREAFRPFAPSVLESKAADHFDIKHASPFMLETCQVKSKIPLPAITHVDGSARIQTVDSSRDHRFAQLLASFDKRTGCPVLLNTSFNVRGEPMVCSPQDALLCFARSRLDVLVLQDFIVDRANLPQHWEQAAERIPVKPSSVRKKVYAML